jgi:hypothetical protein
MKYLITIAITLMILLIGCSNIDEKQAQPTGDIVQAEDNLSNAVEKLEIYHFHGTHQCASCIAVGDYAEETVNTYFADELKSGKIVFAHINAEVVENQELVKKYGVTGSSLWIGVYDENGFHPEQNVNVWYKIQHKDEYMIYLKGIIDKRFAGDYS